MQILDVTLRDGSYAINFQFTARDTAAIGSALEGAGIEWIEIGHGVGLNASACGQGEAAESDEAYLAAAANSLKKARFGMFCIPGIGRVEDIDMAAGYGMGFVRIGTNISDVEQSEPFIARAKRHGMMVASNFMKSYVVSPAEFAARAQLSKQYGSDVVYVVDSAGGMLPEEVESYVQAVHDGCEIDVAFHGHNNLGLSIANSIKAVELGATFVDSSLQGLGRSAGNAQTEVLAAVLQRKGLAGNLDLIALMDAGEKFIRPLVRKTGWSSLDIVTGASQFHSSYMSVIRKYATNYGVDPRRLIEEVCKVDRVSAPEELVEAKAKQLESEPSEVSTARFQFDEYHGHEQNNK